MKNKPTLGRKPIYTPELATELVKTALTKGVSVKAVFLANLTKERNANRTPSGKIKESFHASRSYVPFLVGCGRMLIDLRQTMKRGHQLLKAGKTVAQIMALGMVVKKMVKKASKK